MALDTLLEDIEAGSGTEDGEGDDEDGRLARLLIGRRSRRRRALRRLAIAHLLGEGDGDEEDEDDDSRLARFIVGRRWMRRRGLRRMAIAHLLSGRDEG